jgi:hypothetical protein
MTVGDDDRVDACIYAGDLQVQGGIPAQALGPVGPQGFDAGTRLAKVTPAGLVIATALAGARPSGRAPNQQTQHQWRIPMTDSPTIAQHFSKPTRSATCPSTN